LNAAKIPCQTVLKGHGFSRAEKPSSNFNSEWASAHEEYASNHRRYGRNRVLTSQAPQPALAAAHNLFPTHWGWTALSLGPRGPSAHTSHTQRRGMLVSDQVRLATVTPSSFRKAARKLLRKSGTKALRFVGLGLHTHWKAPAEAQTRFSEEILSLFYRIGSIEHRRSLQAG
jgi:hypothetical protein